MSSKGQTHSSGIVEKTVADRNTAIRSEHSGDNSIDATIEILQTQSPVPRYHSLIDKKMTPDSIEPTIPRNAPKARKKQ